MWNVASIERGVPLCGRAGEEGLRVHAACAVAASPLLPSRHLAILSRRKSMLPRCFHVGTCRHPLSAPHAAV